MPTIDRGTTRYLAVVCGPLGTITPEATRRVAGWERAIEREKNWNEADE